MVDHSKFLTNVPRSNYQSAVESRVTTWFSIYCLMGAERSLESLLETATLLGLKPVSLNTLKNWSSQYGWQDKVAKVDVQARELAVPQIIEAMTSMNLRQARLGRVMQAIGGSTIEIRDPYEISTRDAATLVDIGSKLERLASGAATSRAEITVSVWSELVREIVVLFLEINSQEDSEARKRSFALGVDSLVEGHIAQQGVRG